MWWSIPFTTISNRLAYSLSSSSVNCWRTAQTILSLFISDKFSHYWHLLLYHHSPFRDVIGGAGKGFLGGGFLGGGRLHRDAVAQVVAQSKWLHRLQLCQVSTLYGISLDSVRKLSRVVFLKTEKCAVAHALTPRSAPVILFWLLMVLCSCCFDLQLIWKYVDYFASTQEFRLADKTF